MYATHLQDNESIPDEVLYQKDPVKADADVLRHDRHWIPNVDGSLENGLLDWKLIASYVAKAPLDLPADFEIMLSGTDNDDEIRQLKICEKQSAAFFKLVMAAKNEQ